MIITKVFIERFRGFHKQEFEMGSQITAIAGQNGTQKSTLLGMITQTFTIGKNKSPMYGEKPLCGGSYKSQFQEKFRLSPIFDKPKEHEWTLSFDNLPDFTVESIKRSDSENIRFWKKGSRKEGDGYIQYPTISLSLKRVLPLAESGNKIMVAEELSDEEITEFKRLHNLIMISQRKIDKVMFLNNENKQTMGISTDVYDWNQNSVGQDNLSKILLALFSFKRLKEKYPDEYKGGILAIDELDATMYPASQKELISILRKYSSRLNLQVVFTTHSMSLLESVDDMRCECMQKKATEGHIRIVYLSKQDGNVVINDKATFNNITQNLKVEIGKKEKVKIPVYTEDKENILMAKNLLKKKTSDLDFIDVDFSCNNLLLLVEKKVPAFTAPQSLVILDGDVRKDKKKMKIIAKSNNVLVLPTDKSPEQLTASFLNNLSDSDGLWTSICEGYNKQVCFRSYLVEDILSDRVKAKAWFRREKENWGYSACKVLNPLFSQYSEERDAFLQEFDKIMKLFKV